MTRFRAASGFSLVELLIATAILLIVSSIATSALMQISKHQQTVWNRTEMHSGVRGATELLQQEVGQAGRVALPAAVTPVTLQTATIGALCDGANPATNAVTVNVSSTSGMFVGESLTLFDGDTQESVKVNTVNTGTSQINACFSANHAVGTVIAPLGGFATGIVPPTGIVNGSDGYHLKLYGDVNGDGQMVYVEYFCDNGDAGTASPTHNLYRNVMAFDAASKLAPTASQILLSNVYQNPPPSGSATIVPCFTYQTSTVNVGVTPFTFVLDVAITLTVQTQQVDPVTKAYQKETKALLNVSPRNVFDAWAFAGMGYSNRIQSTPVSVTTLIQP